MGALLLRCFVGGVPLGFEIREHGFFYIYGLIGTSLAFGLFGLLTGLRADRLRQSRDRYESLADHDELTHLLNARAFRRHYDRAIDRARHSGEAFSLLLLDVDALKAINDRWGHSTGNGALIRVANAIARNKRVGDLACRWGGDEFAIVMPGADASVARRVAESILEELAGQAPVESRPRISVAIGIGTSPPITGDLFEYADRALYDAKRRGPGQLRIAGGSEKERPD